MNVSDYLDKTLAAEDQDIDVTRKRIFLSFCIIICIPIIFLFAINDLKNQRIFEGLAILIILAALILNLIALKYAKKANKFFRISIIVTLLLLSYELAIGGGDGQAYLWFYIFPLAAFNVCERIEGILWVSLSLLISSFLFFVPIVYEYSHTTGLRFIVTYSVISILSFGIEFFRNWYYRELMDKKRNLEKALHEVKTLQGLLPICSFCKRIRDDKGYWNQIEAYIHMHSDAVFSHGICPECAEKHYLRSRHIKK
ncbi:MAG: hypothetical protein PVG41_11385 [Desulfobacteraceae bacterium]|jgi:hypothetical protein